MPRKSEKLKAGSASKRPVRAVWRDPDDAPEITDDMLARAEVVKGGKVVQRGRPRLGSAAKVPVTLRVDPDVLATFRATGDGWQSRMNEELRSAARRMERRKR